MARLWGENKVVVSFDGDGTTLILSAYEARTDGSTNTLTAVNYTNDADGTATSAVATDTTVTDVDLSSITFVGLEKLSADSSVSAALTTAQLANINTIETGSDALTVDLDGVALTADLDISTATLAPGSSTIDITNLNGKTLTLSMAQASDAKIQGASGTVRIVATSDALVTDAFLGTLGRGTAASEIATGLTVRLVIDSTDTVDLSGNSVSNLDVYEVVTDNTLIVSDTEAASKSFVGSGTVKVTGGGTQDFTSATFADDTHIDVNGQTLDLTAAQSTSRMIVDTAGSGVLNIKSATASTIYDFSNVAEGLTTTLLYTTGGTLAAGTVNNWAEIDTVDIATGQTLTLTGTQAHAKDITGAGSVTVTALSSKANADFGNLDAAGGVLFDLTDADNITFTGTLAATDMTFNGINGAGGEGASVDITGGTLSTDYAAVDDSFTLGEGVTLTATAAQMDAATVTGAGLAVIQDLASTTGADLDGIATDLTIDLEATNVALAADATLAVATGKTLTVTSTAGTDYQLDVSAIASGSGGVFTVDGEISVSSETTLKLTAAQATTETVTGAGSVVVSALDLTAAANLGSIDAAGGVLFDLTDADNITFTGTLAATDMTFNGIDGAGGEGASVDITGGTLSTDYAAVDDSFTLGEGVTLTATAAQMDAATVTGAGLAVIQDLSLSTSADLDGIATDLTIDLEATNVALAADATLAVATGKTLTVTSTAGTDYQLDVSAIASGSGGVFTVDGEISVSSETTLKLTAAQATTETVTGAGSVVVSALDLTAAADLGSIDAAGGVLFDLTDADNITFTGTLAATDMTFNGIDGAGGEGASVDITGGTLSTDYAAVDDSFTLGEGVTLTATAAQMDAATVTGAGLAVIQDLSLSTSADLDGIATDLTIDLEATNVALAADATLAVATGKTLTVTSTAGTDYQLDVSAIASGSGGVFTVDGDISVSSETTLKLTAAQATTETVTGAGSVVVSALDLTAAANLGSIDAAGGVLFDLTDADNITFTGTLAATDMTFNGIDGAGGEGASVDITGGTLSTAYAAVDDSFTLGEGVTLTATAAQMDAATVTGAGLAVIQDLSLSTSADLDGIATDLTIDLEATNVALAADATLAVATGKTLTVTSTAGTDYQLDVSAIASGSGGVFTVDGDISVSSETTLKLTAAQATTETVTGAGSVVVSALDLTAAADLGSIDAAGGVLFDLTDADNITFTGTLAATDMTFNGIDGAGGEGASVDITGGTLSTDYAAVDDSFTLGEGVTLTATAAQMDAATVTGAGLAVIQDLSLSTSADLDGIATDLTIDLEATASTALEAGATISIAADKTLTVTSTTGDPAQSRLDVTEAATFEIDNGGSGTASIVLANSETELALTAAQATTHAITGSGQAFVTDLALATDADLDGIATDLTIDLEATNVALAADATLAVATGKTLTVTSTAGTDYQLDVSAIASGSGGVFTVDGEISVSSETTLKLTAAQATTETVTGAGSVVVSALDLTAAANLGSIDAAGGVLFDLTDADNITFTGTLAATRYDL